MVRRRGSVVHDPGESVIILVAHLCRVFLPGPRQQWLDQADSLPDLMRLYIILTQEARIILVPASGPRIVAHVYCATLAAAPLLLHYSKNFKSRLKRP